MTSSRLFPWPTIPRNHLDAIIRVTEWIFASADENGPYKLDANQQNGGWVLTAGRGWHPTTHPLVVRCQLEADIPAMVSQRAGQAIISSGMEIAFFLTWQSPRGLVQGSGGVVRRFADRPIDKLTLVAQLPPGTARGRVRFTPEIFVFRVSEQVDTGEALLATGRGAVLADTRSLSTHVHFDGQGSTLPVAEVSDKSAPLWWLELSWDDPRTDYIDENTFLIRVNTVHRDFKELKGSDIDRPYQTPLMMEVMAETLTCFILRLSHAAEWHEIKEGIDLEPASLGQMAHYWLSISSELEKHLEEPERLARIFRSLLATRRAALG